eukprot:augustus_masked-scaffold_4-processed-gene-19.9-mRNA-1 protein AED:1.00 eAED:1.00 QI:0/0/0/0/1/1/4/0/788
MIIGNDILKKYNLDSLSALKGVMKKSQKVCVFTEAEGCETLARWFEDTVQAEKLLVKGVKKIFVDPLSEEEYEEPIQVRRIEEFDKNDNDWRDLWRSDASYMVEKEEDTLAYEEIAVKELDKLVKRANPIVFLRDELKDEVDLEEIDEGAKLDRSKMEDMNKMRSVLKQRPLGFEQEKFLVKRVKQMEKAGIIKVNNNPTTAMSVLVVPKKGPKKFGLVVDFRPLNNITTRVSNTLPLIEFQISRARNKKLFSSFDLLSGFDYLPAKGSSSEYFTFTTPWGVAYSFCGSPEGWCNTPSLFSMRQITDVLEPCNLWPEKAMQWIDDTIPMADSLDEMYSILERYLKRIQAMKLRLSIEKFIRKLVTGEYNISGKLKNLERKRLKLVWTDELTMTFSMLIEALEKSLKNTLGHYRHNEGVYIFSDASDSFWSLYITQCTPPVNYANSFRNQFQVIALKSGVFKNSSLDWHSLEMACSFSVRKAFLLISDQGSHFVNQVVQKFLRQSGGAQRLTAAYVSQTNGTVEVQNRSILKHLRTLVSEFGLPHDKWPSILLMVQSYLNMSKLTCRGPERRTPFELLMGVEPNFLSVGEQLCGISGRNAERLRRASEDLSRKIQEYQELAYSQGLAYRAMANRRLNQKLKPINFHCGEYVLMSEKGTDSGSKYKCRPRWCGPLQITKIISEHLYEVEDLNGKKRIRHSSLLIPFAPSSFLPDANTKAVFITDKGKLEVEKIYDIRENVDSEIKLKMKWKGFPLSQSTWESAVIMFEDIPIMVVEFLKKENSSLSVECA